MAETHTEHRGGYGIYLRTWGWLLAITALEVTIVLAGIPRIVMIPGLIVLALMKAALIVAYFMHLRLERLTFVYTVLVPMILIVVLFFGLVPDAFSLRQRAVPVPSVEEMERAARAAQPRQQARPAGPVVTVIASEFKFTPATLQVKAGQVQIQVRNGGAIPHSFRITDLGNVGIEPVNPGASQAFTANVPSGTHRFICDVPGHAAAGMVGQIIARP